MEDLITHANVLFDERAAATSHPLPPAPADEPPPAFGYGSSYTQVATVPPRHQKTDSRSSQDFTPQLPPRPGNSIHPSRRAANQSSRTISSDVEDESNPTDALRQRRPSTTKSVEAGPPPVPEEDEVDEEDVSISVVQPTSSARERGGSVSASSERNEAAVARGAATPSTAPSSPKSTRSPRKLHPEVSGETRDL